MNVARVLVCTVPLAALAGLPAASGASGPCAPPGTQAPHLSIRGTPDARTLTIENGPVLGRAWLLAKGFVHDGASAPRPGAVGCLADARGVLLTSASLDAQGRWEVAVPASVLAMRPLLTAVVAPKGGGLDEAALSNSIQLGTYHDRPPAGVPGGASIVITEFMKDPAAVGDSVGEWIELQNVGTAAVDIEGWILSDLGSDSIALVGSGSGIVIPAGGALVLGRSADPAVNGGVPVDFVYASYTLSNGDDEIVLSLPGGQLVDQVAYDGAWPGDPGRSVSLRPSARDAAANDDPLVWCSSSTPLVPGGTDTGTPGAANDPCP